MKGPIALCSDEYAFLHPHRQGGMKREEAEG